MGGWSVDDVQEACDAHAALVGACASTTSTTSLDVHAMLLDADVTGAGHEATTHPSAGGVFPGSVPAAMSRVPLVDLLPFPSGGSRLAGAADAAAAAAAADAVPVPLVLSISISVCRASSECVFIIFSFHSFFPDFYDVSLLPALIFNLFLHFE
jgi:hypothetical protein